MLACASNQESDVAETVIKLAEKAKQAETENTYEFFFNLSQVQMKQQLHQEAFKSLLESYELSRQEGEHQHEADQARFKIQELHALNTFSGQFSLIEYNLGGPSSGPRFNLPRSLKHENLVEVNMSALAQENGSFEGIDREHFKDLIGNLNWNKFSERIANQLATNQNLTAEQKKALQVNLVVALIRSN